MTYYLNRGFIVEQALVDIIKRYFHSLFLDSVYQNFHISVTNDHPFAHLMVHQDSQNTGDVFPAVVITSESDNKVPDMMGMPPQVEILSLNSSDIDDICENKRIKTYIDEKTGEEVVLVKKDGTTSYENIPGYCVVASDEVVAALKEKAEKQNLYGISLTTRKRDNVSIEIWSENNQLKNEIFEQLRLFLSTSAMDKVLNKKFGMFDPVIPDTSINGQRSNNFNFDFDVALYGAHISFEIDYWIQQIVIDTEIQSIKEIETEVQNYVKK